MDTETTPRPSHRNRWHYDRFNATLYFDVCPVATIRQNALSTDWHASRNGDNVPYGSLESAIRGIGTTYGFSDLAADPSIVLTR